MGVPLEFRLLGPTEARRDGEILPLSGARRRALVARLLLDAGCPVPVDRILDDVWFDARAPSRATIQSHVSQLRKALGDCIRSELGCYVLDICDATLDTYDFESAVHSASGFAARGRPGEAVGPLHSALARWRGRALQDVAERPWAMHEAARLEELRRFATEQLLAARLATGDNDRVAVDAEAAVAEEPLREQRWATLVLALYRCGRQADALRACERLRHQLLEDLGIDPSPPLVALEAAILRQDPQLDLPGDSAIPDDARASAIGAAHRAADERDWGTACRLLTNADAGCALAPSDLEVLGDAAFMSGQQAISISARQRAHHIWLQQADQARAAIVAFLIVGNHYVWNRPATAAGWFQRGRRLLERLPLTAAHGVQAYTEALMALASGHLEAAATAADEAQRIGAKFQVPDIEAIGRTLRGCALMRLGALDDAQRLLDEALAWAASAQLGPVATGQIFCWTTQALLAAGDLGRAAEWIEMIDSCGVGGIPGDCRVHRAEALRALGELERAYAEAVAARSEIQSVDLLHVGIAHYELAMIDLERGEFDQASKGFGLAVACGSSGQPGMALLHLARGEMNRASASINAALAATGPDDLGRAPLLAAAVRIANAVGDEDEANRRAAGLVAITMRGPSHDLNQPSYGLHGGPAG